jgi:hypothetical protein
MVIRVEHGKGRKDRYLMLSAKLEILPAWGRVERPKDWLLPADFRDRPISKFVGGV